MRHHFAAAAALLLVSCGGGEGGNEAAGGNETAGGNAAAAAGNEASGEAKAEGGGGDAAAASLDPGQWEITTQVTSMNVEGMPQGANMPLPPPTTIRACITPEQAGQPGANVFTGGGENSGCSFESSNMRGGRIEATVQCNNAGGSMRSRMAGQYGGSSFEVNQQVETAAGGQTVEMETRTSGRRVGDCPG